MQKINVGFAEFIGDVRCAPCGTGDDVGRNLQSLRKKVKEGANRIAVGMPLKFCGRNRRSVVGVEYGSKRVPAGSGWRASKFKPCLWNFAAGGCGVE